MEIPAKDVPKEARALSSLVLICGILTVCFGFTALLGWAAGLPVLTAFVSGRIPMAPSTALLFLLYGTGTILVARSTSSRAVSRTVMVIGSAGALVSLLLFLLSSLGIHPEAEHLGLQITGTINGAPIGHMSPLTAFCFLLAGFSLIALLSSSPSRLWHTNAALGLAFVIILISSVLLMAYLLGLPLLYDTGIIPPALSTSMAFMVLGAALLVSSVQRVRSHGKPDDISNLWASYVFVAIFVLMATGIITIGYLSYRNVSEVYAPVRERLWVMVVLVIALLIGAAGGIGLVLRQLSVMFYRKQYMVAEELREREERYRSLFENMLNGFAYCKMLFENNKPVDFIYLDVNTAFEKLTGLKNVIGKKVSDVIPGIRDADPKLFEIYGKVALTGRPEKFEIYVAALRSWFSISVYSPKLDHFVAVFDVITERKLAEEELRNHERLLREMGRVAKIGGWDFDPSTGKGTWTDEVARIHDLDPADETSVERGMSFYHGESRMKIENAVKEAVEFGKPYDLELEMVTAKGAHKWVQAIGYPTVENGKVAHVRGSLQDITERKSLESQLRQAQKMEAIGQLAGGIAHDFNNIISAIINYAYLIKNMLPENDPLRVQIGQISSLSMKASEITRGLLALSRKSIVNLIPISINKVMLEIGKLLSKFIGEDIHLDFRLSDKDLIIMADSSHIEQVIINLATNARDAMPDGGSFTIETDRVIIDDAFIHMHGFGTRGTYALLSFTDTGIGMDEETKQRIFEPFFTTKEAGKGTGLGMAIIYGIVKQHEGYINVYSEPGMGTTFKIYFRIVDAAVPEIKETGPSDLAGHAETILLAEDEEAVRNSVKIILEQFGYRVIEAVNGDDAIEKYREHKDRIDLLLLDVIMPKKNGKEAYEEIKKITPGIKVIFTSGYSADIIDKKGIIADGFTHILKPLSPDKLLLIIKEALQNG